MASWFDNAVQSIGNFVSGHGFEDNSQRSIIDAQNEKKKREEQQAVANKPVVQQQTTQQPQTPNNLLTIPSSVNTTKQTIPLGQSIPQSSMDSYSPATKSLAQIYNNNPQNSRVSGIDPKIFGYAPDNAVKVNQLQTAPAMPRNTISPVYNGYNVDGLNSENRKIAENVINTVKPGTDLTRVLSTLKSAQETKAKSNYENSIPGKIINTAGNVVNGIKDSFINTAKLAGDIIVSGAGRLTGNKTLSQKGDTAIGENFSNSIPGQMFHGAQMLAEPLGIAIGYNEQYNKIEQDPNTSPEMKTWLKLNLENSANQETSNVGVNTNNSTLKNNAIIGGGAALTVLNAVTTAKGLDSLFSAPAKYIGNVESKVLQNYLNREPKLLNDLISASRANDTTAFRAIADSIELPNTRQVLLNLADSADAANITKVGSGESALSKVSNIVGDFNPNTSIPPIPQSTIGTPVLIPTNISTVPVSNLTNISSQTPQNVISTPQVTKTVRPENEMINDAAKRLNLPKSTQDVIDKVFNEKNTNGGTFNAAANRIGLGKEWDSAVKETGHADLMDFQKNNPGVGILGNDKSTPQVTKTGTLYHGTTNKQAIDKNGFIVSKGGSQGPGVYFTDNPTQAKNISGVTQGSSKTEVVSATLKPDTKLYVVKKPDSFVKPNSLSDRSNIPFDQEVHYLFDSTNADPQKAAKMVIDAGYDGIKIGNDTVIYNTDKIVSAPQVTTTPITTPQLTLPETTSTTPTVNNVLKSDGNNGFITKTPEQVATTTKAISAIKKIDTKLNIIHQGKPNILSAPEVRSLMQQRDHLLSVATGDNSLARDAIWHNGSTDQSVKITGIAGEKGGRQYVNIEGSKSAVPLDEVTLNLTDLSNPGAAPTDGVITSNPTTNDIQNIMQSVFYRPADNMFDGCGCE